MAVKVSAFDCSQASGVGIVVGILLGWMGAKIMSWLFVKISIYSFSFNISHACFYIHR